jgi:hypothetical protein
MTAGHRPRAVSSGSRPSMSLVFPVFFTPETATIQGFGFMETLAFKAVDKHRVPRYIVYTIGKE